MSEKRSNDINDSARDELLRYLGMESGEQSYDSDFDESDIHFDGEDIYSDGELDDIDFSDYTGNFKKSFRKINRRVDSRSLEAHRRSRGIRRNG